MNASLSDLNDICLDVIANCESINPDTLPYFQFLYNTGSRPSDALYKDYLVSLNYPMSTFQPSKKNNTRLISTDVIPIDMLFHFEGTSLTYNRGKYRTFLRVFQSITKGYDLRVSSRPLDMYIFRYRYVRNLFNNGLSVAEIVTNMGWKNTNICESYLNRIITLNR